MGDGAEVVTAASVLSDKHILQKIDEQMEQADLCIFDLTSHNANVALELGVAHKAPYPYLILYCTDPALNPKAEIFADMAGWDSIRYGTPEELERIVRDRVVPHLMTLRRRVRVGRADVRPNLTVEASSGDNPANGQRFLEGTIQNVGRGVASDVRLVATSFDRSRFGFTSLIPGQSPERFSVRYDDQPIPMSGPAQFPGVRAEFQDEDGVIYAQTAHMKVFGPDASGRYHYALKGLRRAEVIPEYTLVGTPWRV